MNSAPPDNSKLNRHRFNRAWHDSMHVPKKELVYSILPKIMIEFYIVYVGSSSPGTVEIELQYNNLNPLHPVLLVKLTDVIFYSTKGLSSGTIHLL